MFMLLFDPEGLCLCSLSFLTLHFVRLYGAIRSVHIHVGLAYFSRIIHA